jgi:hypothetical protein
MNNKLAIGISAIENISVSKYYTNNAINSVKYWSNYYDVFVHTNNPNEFLNLNCQIITDTIDNWSLHDKIFTASKILIDYESCLIIDGDLFPKDSTNKIDIDVDNLEYGIHFSDYWLNPDKTILRWQNIKHLNYWKTWIENFDILNTEDFTIPSEQLILFKGRDKIIEFIDLVMTKYKNVAIDNDIRFFKINNNIDNLSWQGMGRCEGLSFVLASKELNIPIFIGNDTFKQIRNKLLHRRY